MRNLIIGLILISLFGCQSKEQFSVSITPSMEDKTADGKPYTPGTQSFLRGHHWLENIEKATFSFDDELVADIEFFNKDKGNHYLKVKNIPLQQLVPRLHYKVGEQPDEFDYFNLMLAEYSRNGISFPFAKEGDAITHFETDLKADIPWKLKKDYEFTKLLHSWPLSLNFV